MQKEAVIFLAFHGPIGKRGAKPLIFIPQRKPYKRFLLLYPENEGSQVIHNTIVTPPYKMQPYNYEKEAMLAEWDTRSPNQHS